METKIGIRFHVENYDSVLQRKIYNLLQEKLRNFFSDTIKVEFLYSEPYWKFENETIVVFELTCLSGTSVKTLIKIFPFTWDYGSMLKHEFENETKNDLSGSCYAFENAIWSKHINPQEILLDENIQWCHISD